MRHIRKRRASARRRIAATLLLLAGLIGFLDVRASSWLLTFGEHQARARVTEIVSGTVADTLREQPSAMTVLQRDAAGNVTSLQTDTAAVSRLQAAVVERLAAVFDAGEDVSFSVPIGTLLGGAWTSGRGPELTFYLQLDGAALITPRETFSAAGINQCCHTVYLDVQMQFLLMAAGRQQPMEVTVPTVVSQTVLLGGVPETYVNVEKK